MINYGKQDIQDSDILAVLEVLKSDWLTQGPKVVEFEKALAEYCGAKYAIAVSNGTAALHLANLAIGQNKTTNVITTPVTFLASANSVLYTGGCPIFADISEKTFTINPEQVQKVIDGSTKITGLIPVHLGGVISELESIYQIAQENNLWIIEDACHALGGKWQDKNGQIQVVGNCTYSDMTVFSFHPVKQITTGEGGAITTNSKRLYDKLLSLRTHGMTKDPARLTEKHGGWYYEMHDLGFNYRITDFQAALGIEQLKRNDDWVLRRRELVYQYDEAFQELEEVIPQTHPDREGSFSYHLYIIQTDKRLELFNYLKVKGVNTQVHYIPIHLQPYYKNRFGYKRGDYPVAELYYSRTLSLPLYPTLKNSEQNKIISLVKQFHAKS